MNAQQYSVESGIVPRFQWNANSGYCGETSFICAGLKYGQYCSQFTARQVASSLPQYDSGSQLLLGTGRDARAAVEMRLAATEFPGGPHVPPAALIVWVKSQLSQGNVPIIGVLNNVTALNEPGPGDPQYDHIVPILGMESEFPVQDENGGVEYHATDVITLSDNGLYGPDANGDYPLRFSYEVASFQGDRAQANEQGGPVYMLNSQPPNYGIAIQGVADEDGVCLPVSLASDRHREPNPPPMDPAPPPSPQLAQPPLCDAGPVPFALKQTATVDLGGQTGPCNLYLYDDFSLVPVRGFNAAAAHAVRVWNIPAGWGPTFVVEHDAMSSDTVVFRAVPASAP